VGLPGALAYGLILVLAMKQLHACCRRSGSADDAAALALLVLYVIHNTFVSVQLATQLQTFVVLAIVMKLAFIPEPERIPEVGHEPANG